MSRKRFSKTQIIAVWLEHEAGSPPEALCGKHGISQRTFYRWKSAWSRVPQAKLQDCKVLAEENLRLKQLLSESMPIVGAMNKSDGSK